MGHKLSKEQRKQEVQFRKLRHSREVKLFREPEVPENYTTKKPKKHVSKDYVD